MIGVMVRENDEPHRRRLPLEERVRDETGVRRSDQGIDHQCRVAPLDGRAVGAVARRDRLASEREDAHVLPDGGLDEFRHGDIVD